MVPGVASMFREPTTLLLIKNNGNVIGNYTDDTTEDHGITGH
jgi:hypothetical protein